MNIIILYDFLALLISQILNLTLPYHFGMMKMIPGERLMDFTIHHYYPGKTILSRFLSFSLQLVNCSSPRYSL
jgi:hypothetical protein